MSPPKSILIKVFIALFIFSLGITVGLLLAPRSTLQKSVVIDEQSKPKDAVIERIITPIKESVKTRKYTDLTCGFEITIPKDMVETVESQGKPCNKVRFFQNQKLKEDYLVWKATNPNPITDKNMDKKPVGLSFLVSNFDENNLEEPGNDTWLNKDQTDNIPQDFKIYVGGAYDVPYNMCATKKEGSNYYISFSDCDQNLYNNPIFQQILSSFRFTDPTASWSTYRNQKYGFEFKYPSEYKLEKNIPGGGDKYSTDRIVSVDYKMEDFDLGSYVTQGIEYLITLDERSGCVLDKKQSIGDPAIKEIWSKDVGGKSVRILHEVWDTLNQFTTDIDGGNYCLTLSVNGGKNYPDTAIKTQLEQILDTFKIVK